MIWQNDVRSATIRHGDHVIASSLERASIGVSVATISIDKGIGCGMSLGNYVAMMVVVLVAGIVGATVSHHDKLETFADAKAPIAAPVGSDFESLVEPHTAQSPPAPAATNTASTRAKYADKCGERRPHHRGACRHHGGVASSK